MNDTTRIIRAITSDNKSFFKQNNIVPQYWMMIFAVICQNKSLIDFFVNSGLNTNNHHAFDHAIIEKLPINYLDYLLELGFPLTIHAFNTSVFHNKEILDFLVKKNEIIFLGCLYNNIDTGYEVFFDNFMTCSLYSIYKDKCIIYCNLVDKSRLKDKEYKLILQNRELILKKINF